MFKLTPKNDRFYAFFDQGASYMVEASEKLHDLLTNFMDVKTKVSDIEQLEHEADKNTHAAMELLHKSFITPIDRGDIRRFVVALDDVIDYTDRAASRLLFFEIKTVPQSAQRLSEVLVATCRETEKAVKEIRNIHKKSGILEHCVEINRLEGEADHLHHSALAELFRPGTDPLHVIKWKEILQCIEDAADRCEHLASLIEGLVLENG